MPEGEWFCSDECVRIRDALGEDVAAGEVLMPGNPAYRWQILRGKNGRQQTWHALSTVLNILQVRV